MKKNLYLLVLVIVVVVMSCKKATVIKPIIFGKTVESIVIDNSNRKYSIYIPSLYNVSNPSTMIVLLHGINGTKDESDSLWRELDALGYNIIGVSLQALPEEDQLLKILATNFRFPLDAVWGKTGSSGTFASFGISSTAGSFELNKNIDDVKYINAVIDNTKNKYAINSQRIFMIGISLGGALAYSYAFSENPQCKAMAIFSGFIGRSLNTSGIFKMPTIHLHGTSDEIVPYEGNGILNDNIPASVIEFITSKKTSRNLPIETIVPHKQLDNKTITKYDYVESPRVLFYKIDNATHSLQDMHDINLITETLKFFNEVSIN